MTLKRSALYAALLLGCALPSWAAQPSSGKVLGCLFGIPAEAFGGPAGKLVVVNGIIVGLNDDGTLDGTAQSYVADDATGTMKAIEGTTRSNPAGATELRNLTATFTAASGSVALTISELKAAPAKQFVGADAITLTQAANLSFDDQSVEGACSEMTAQEAQAAARLLLGHH